MKEYLISVFYFMVGAAVYLLKYALNFVDSIENPTFVVLRQSVKLYLGMIFTKRTYKKIGYDEEAIRRGNKYIDDLLEDMFKNRAKEYDPYVIEDSVVGFNKKVIFVNVSGEAKFHDGYIKGLSTLHRNRDCALQNEGEEISVKADLGAGALDFHYSGSVKFMNYGPTITVEGVLSYIEVHIEFTADSKTGKNGRLNKFIVDDMRGMKVWITGLGPLNWAINPIVSGVTKLFKRFVRNFLENKVEKHIGEHIQNFKFPVEGNETAEASKETAQPETGAPKETAQPETEV